MVLPHKIGALQVDDDGHPEGHHDVQRVELVGLPATEPSKEDLRVILKASQDHPLTTARR